MTLTLKDIVSIMKHIDICMLTTTGPRGVLESRPMSNNREVEYDGNNYFFTRESSDLAKDIKRSSNVNLAFSGHHSLLSRKHVYISVIGKAELVKDKEEMKRHWSKDLDLWFKKGVDTPGVVMVHVKSKSLKYWDGWEMGTVKVGK